MSGAADSKSEGTQAPAFKTWQCYYCGLVYDEEKGWPDGGIAPGTRWEDVPEDWVCPDCNAAKADFYMLESA